MAAAVSSASQLPVEKILNVNVGVLGHIDSGKTSLVKALSTVGSTAAFDKSPQSQQRGITLDLGFSSFMAEVPEHLRHLPYDKIQFTLVDCPGHASLIRTIIGGAQIIDMMILVIDITKGIQTQTAEGLVIGDITTDHLVVALNKVDLLPPDPAALDKAQKRIIAALKSTKFASAPLIPVAARPGAPAVMVDRHDVEDKPEPAPTATSTGSAEKGKEKAIGPPVGLDALVDTLRRTIPADVPTRRAAAATLPFLFAADHCFAVRGQGTVITGTVLNGTVGLNDVIEIPHLRIQRKVKTLQMFHRPVMRASAGDRVGICVTQLDPKSLERGFVAAPDVVPTVSGVVLAVDRIRYYRGPIRTKAKFHVTVGHHTVMATCYFFGRPEAATATTASAADTGFDFAAQYPYQEELYKMDEAHPHGSQYALLVFERPTPVPPGAVAIGSRLDTDVHTNTCRLAFHGKVLTSAIDPANPEQLARLQVYKWKSREGAVDRVVSDTALIAKGLFKRETDISLFAGMTVTKEPEGWVGRIEGAFGKSGKCKVTFASGGLLAANAGGVRGPIVLRFKHFVFDKQRRLVQ